MKRIGRAFVSKHAAEPLKHSAKLFKHSAEHLGNWEKTETSAGSLKSSAECLKNSAACLCYNTAHTVPISNGKSEILWLELWKNRVIPLRLALRILSCYSKTTFNHPCDYRVTSASGEAQKFKKSTAVNSAKGCYLHVVPVTNRLFQVLWYFRYKLLCHCLSTVLTKNEKYVQQKNLVCFKKNDLATSIKELNTV